MEKQEYKIMHDIEGDYWWYRGLHELVLASLKKFFPNKKAEIFDAGCGTGRMLELIGQAGYENSVGIDYAEEAINFCQKRGLKNVAKKDLNFWQPEGESCDGLISLDVLYHSAVIDDSAVIKKFYSALRPGGILILNLPAFEFLKRGHDAAVWTKKRYRAGKLKKDLQAAGFNVELAAYRLPWLFFIMLLKKISEKIFKPQEKESDLKKMPKILNNFFLALNRLDNEALLKKISLPFGSSVFVVCRKQANLRESFNSVV